MSNPPGQSYQQYPMGGGGTGIGNIRDWTVNAWIMAIVIVTLFADALLKGRLINLTYFSLASAAFGLQVWRFVTFQFVEPGIISALFDLFTLFFFGRMMEGHFGPRKYLVFVLLCGGGAIGIYVALWAVGLMHIMGAATPLAGLGPTVMGVVVGAATLQPNGPVQMVFPPVQVKLLHIAWIFIGISLYMAITTGPDTAAGFTELAGGLVGWLLVKNDRWQGMFERRAKGGASGKRGTYRDWTKDF
ncbi:MAG TPA: rhomboid family intramembrane serine protease [Tepidisphaeraceae bacterium]|nr:rhomboid family intramembrane serine protease [Tepidisphaeraceae bacterium]